MKEIDLKQIKSMEELKKELGNKYDEVMYKMNLELFNRMNKALTNIDILQEIIYKQPSKNNADDMWILDKLDGIKFVLKGSEKE